MRLLFAIAGIGCLALLGAACSPSEPPMLKMCERVLKQRLKAPSGYKRIEYTQIDKPLTVDEYIAAMTEHTGVPTSDSFKALAEKGEPSLFKIVIEYDAPNEFGTPMRDLSTCDFVDVHSDFSAKSDTFIRIDGLTNAQWLKKGLGL